MKAPHPDEVDPFDLPEWLGTDEVTWTSASGLRSGHLVTGTLYDGETPFFTTSMGPVTGNAATGVPQAIASSITRPNVSVREGKTNTSPLAYSSTNCWPLR